MKGPGSWLFGLPLALALLLPIVALATASSLAELGDALAHPMMARAAWLSVRTSCLSLALIVAFGTPLSWRLSRSRRRSTRALEALLELPIVIPPAVLGVGLLAAYGRGGLLGTELAFTSGAVVVAQVVVAAPFYVQAATAGFRKVDDDLLLVAQTLGANPTRAFLKVAVPAAMPSLAAGAALCWARALGEFGATLLFAGNLPGSTQTMPLAIYSALEVDIGLARGLALVLGGAAFVVLVSVRVLPGLVGPNRRGRHRGRSRAHA